MISFWTMFLVNIVCSVFEGFQRWEVGLRIKRQNDVLCSNGNMDASPKKEYGIHIRTLKQALELSYGTP